LQEPDSASCHAGLSLVGLLELENKGRKRAVPQNRCSVIKNCCCDHGTAVKYNIIKAQYCHCYTSQKTLLLRSRYHSTIIASLLRSQYHVQYNIITAQYCHFYGRDRAARTGLCSGFEQDGAVTQKLPAREADERMRIQKNSHLSYKCVCARTFSFAYVFTLPFFNERTQRRVRPRTKGTRDYISSARSNSRGRHLLLGKVGVEERLHKLVLLRQPLLPSPGDEPMRWRTAISKRARRCVAQGTSGFP
jgi:hypothetical protein